jgi:hypothetical protein
VHEQRKEVKTEKGKEKRTESTKNYTLSERGTKNGKRTMDLTKINKARLIKVKKHLTCEIKKR